MLIFDILREAGTRMPTAIGQAVNIVGTLVLGQAAVDAHLVSSPVIIVTAISGITTFMHPTMIESVVILRLVLIIAASFLGIYGYLIDYSDFITFIVNTLFWSSIHDGSDKIRRTRWSGFLDTCSLVVNDATKDNWRKKPDKTNFKT